MPSVFVSYAREDLERIRRLLDGLSRNGVSVWRDEVNLRGGQNWPEALGKAIDESEFFLLAWSKHAAGSEPVKNEWNTAIALNKTIIPCLLDQTQLPHSLAAKQWIDAKDLDKAIIAITNSILGGHAGEDRRPRKPILKNWKTLALMLAVLAAIILATAFWMGRYQTLAGQVLDKQTGKPLQGAIVRITGDGIEQVTDQDGYFRFDKVQAPRDEPVRFTIRKNGYDEKSYSATLPNTDLRPSLQSLEKSN
jgi:hypothetical protein